MSFLILDWQLFSIMPGIDTHGLQEQNDSDNINFLIQFSKECFCPIFIFTNESVDDIVLKLSEKGLYNESGPNRIFIKNKVDVVEVDLFREITKWMKSTPFMYVLKQWQYEYDKARSCFFNEFQTLNPYWPLVMWKTYKNDGIDPSVEIGDLVTRNLYARMSPFHFDGSIFGKQYPGINKTELRLILQGERYVGKEYLQKDDKQPGDLFKEKDMDDNPIYWLNIRARCDLVRDSNPDLYCLKGTIIDESLINSDKGPKFLEGQFIERVDNAIIAFIDEGVIVEFLLHDLEKFKWNDKKENRIGRIFPPYINKIQQKYVAYLERQGLPRIPKDVINENKA
ncbi:MAG: hypothetical protein LBE13_05800 [Bacteroidales bacterium]|nr:hypothetical protein [Bacteroidales bacterium]